MTSRISHTSFDARDAYAQSVFWSQVLDFIEDPDDPNEPGHQECLIMSRDRSQLLLLITVYRFRTRHEDCDLRFGQVTMLGQDRGLCLFVSCT